VIRYVETIGSLQRLTALPVGLPVPATFNGLLDSNCVVCTAVLHPGSDSNIIFNLDLVEVYKVVVKDDLLEGDTAATGSKI
jgi:hypothetical protein